MRIGKVLLIGGLGYLAWKGKGLLDLSKHLTFSVIGLDQPKLVNGVMSTTVQISADNPTNTQVTLSSVEVEIFQLTTDGKAWVRFANGINSNPQTIVPKAATPLQFSISKPATDLPKLIIDVIQLIKGQVPSYKVKAIIRLSNGITTQQTQYFPESAKEVLP